MMATYVYASSKGQCTHSARTKIYFTLNSGPYWQEHQLAELVCDNATHSTYLPKTKKFKTMILLGPHFANNNFGY